MANRWALRESEDRYRSVVSAMAEGVVVQDTDSVILACNDAAEKLLGLTADQMMGRSSLDPRWRAIHEDGSPFPGETHPVPITLRTGVAQRDVVMGVHKPDGTLTWISINTEPLFREDESRPYAALCTFSDITPRKLAESSLRRSEERYRLILETTLEGVWMIDLEGNTTYGNARMAEILGCTLDELARSNVWQFVDDADREVVQARLAARAQGVGEVHDFRLRRSDGRHVWTSMVTSPLTHVDGTKGAVAMVRDVTEERRLQAELRENEQRLELALSAGQMGAWEWTVGEGVAASRQVRDILGLPSDAPIVDRAAYFRWVHPDDRDELSERMQRYAASDSTERFVNVYRIVRPDGEVRWVQSSGRAVQGPTGKRRILGILADITESRALEEQLQQARRLESIGRLAGGVAHDFNNLLTAILASVTFAETLTAPGLEEELHTIRAAAERGADLTRQLLAFARKQVIDLAPLDLDELVRELVPVLRRLVGESIELVFELGAAPWLVRGGATQVEQLLVNLVVNACEAMPDGGPLVIATRRITLDATAHDVAAGEYITLAVRDAGEGIDPEVLPQIFEPFFTTKRTGTGLGLASAFGIAKQLGGHIRVDSTRGKGTTFTTYFPRCRDTSRPERQRATIAPAMRAMSTILLVEDDDLLRRVVVRGLASSGYQVLAAADGEQALDLARHHDGPIDVVVTDVIMPRISGRQLAERLGAVLPDVKLLFVSGYTDQIIARQNVIEPGQEFLAKPYTISQLRARIDELLSR